MTAKGFKNSFSAACLVLTSTAPYDIVSARASYFVHSGGNTK
jgi:hypothetical protein